MLEVGFKGSKKPSSERRIPHSLDGPPDLWLSLFEPCSFAFHRKVPPNFRSVYSCTMRRPEVTKCRNSIDPSRARCNADRTYTTPSIAAPAAGECPSALGKAPECLKYSAASGRIIRYCEAPSGRKIVFQSFFISTTIQCFAIASSSAVLSFPTDDWRS